MPLTIPSQQVILMVDMITAAGGAVSSPSPQMAAWILPIATGQTAVQTAAAFAGQQKFPVGTKAYLVDLSAATLAVQSFQLTSQWVAA